MPTRTRRTQRRTEALSPERIVEAAIELLDTAGEDGLTFRALAGHLATGSGAIYWHVANKGELLSAATDAVVAEALAPKPAASAPRAAKSAASSQSPRAAIHAVALGLLDAIEEHPWLAAQIATQLSRSPWGPVTPRIYESVGRQVRALGVPEDSWFTAASVLVHYILGAAGQNAANVASVRAVEPEADRAAFLGAAAKAWEQLDPEEYPFIRTIADQVREHDDREQFLDGIDLVLAGITALHPAVGTAGAAPAV